MAIVYSTNSKTGIKYAYENKPYWDKEKKQARSKRKLIGKVDPATGEIVPTRSYNKRVAESPDKLKEGQIPAIMTERQFIGASYLLDQIGKATGVEEDLKACFPREYKKILSLAYYLILEENNSLSRFSHWHRLHRHPYGKDLTASPVRELFQGIFEERRAAFFEQQDKRRSEEEYWAIAATVIPSYEDTLNQIRLGKDQEAYPLAQLNLALLFGEESGMPLYYRMLSDTISDVKTVQQLGQELAVRGFPQVNVLLDAAFYSEENIKGLHETQQPFLMDLYLDVDYVKEVLDKEWENLEDSRNLDSQFNTYGICRPMEGAYWQEPPGKSAALGEKDRPCLHLFYEPPKAEREGEERNEDNDQPFAAVSKGGCQEELSRETAKERAEGCLAMLSNAVRDPFQALSLYRSKERVETLLDNLMDRLSYRQCESSRGLVQDGKLFVGFVALIYLSYLEKKLQQAKLFDRWTLREVLDELDLVEVYKTKEGRKISIELTKKQQGLFQSLGITPPA